MAFSFTEEEKRFVLAEAIKTSDLDVDVLVALLRANNIEPDWLKMQLPSGRTMEQCLAATEHMFQGGMKIPDLKRKTMNDLLEQPPKRRAVASPLEPPAQLPMPSPLAHAHQASTVYTNPTSIQPVLPAPTQLHSSTQGTNPQLANIQPRPISSAIDGGAVSNGYPSPNLPQTVTLPPRKRGRPSRADKARQLRPLLPQHYTPLAPAPRPPARESPGTPAEGSAYSLSPGPTLETPSGTVKRKRGRPRSADKAQPSAYRADQPRAHSGSSRPSTPGEPSRGRSDESPRQPYNEHAQPSGSQKERAIPHIGRLTQEGLTS